MRGSRRTNGTFGSSGTSLALGSPDKAQVDGAGVRTALTPWLRAISAWSSTTFCALGRWPTN
jgi:hypothetical protein